MEWFLRSSFANMKPNRRYSAASSLQYKSDHCDAEHLKALLLDVAAGSEPAFRELYDNCANTLFSAAFKMMQNVAEAEDVFQEAMVKVWRKAGHYQPERGGAIGWLLTVVKNTARDRIRSVGRKRAAVPATIEYFEILNETKRHDDSAESLELKESGQSIFKALLSIPKAEGQAIRLNFFEGLTHREVADKLGTPVGTVKSRIRRGLMKLRSLAPEPVYA